MANIVFATLKKVGETLGLKDLDPESGRILVTSPLHDAVGYRVVQRLLRAGYPLVRVGITGKELSMHDSPKTNAILEEWNHHEHAEVATFDWELEDTWQTALKDVKSVLVCMPYKEPIWYQKHFPQFVKACEKAGVRHLVKLSFYHARYCHNSKGVQDRLCHGSKCAYHDVMYVRAQGKCDQILVDSVQHPASGTSLVDAMLQNKMSFTILYSGRYMSDPFMTQGRELHRDQKPAPMYGASQNQKVNYISPNDVAEAAVRIILEPRAHYNREYTLTNSHDNIITDQEVAGLISKHLGKPVMYVNQGFDQYRDELRTSGCQDYHVKDYVAWERIKAEGVEALPEYASKDLEELCGHPPESYSDYLVSNLDMTPPESTTVKPY
jgi:NAD(P)H dehydrogenase (quinone)